MQIKDPPLHHARKLSEYKIFNLSRGSQFYEDYTLKLKLWCPCTEMIIIFQME